jgi:hypothetical protein
MAAATLISLFPKPEDVLALTPEELGGVIIELMPPLLQNGMFNLAALLAQAGPSYPPGSRRTVELAAAEAISWLVTEGLLVPDPGQPSHNFYVPTRRAKSLKTRTDVEAFRKGRILPAELCRRRLPRRSFRCSAAATTTWPFSRPSRRSRSP